MSKRKNEISIMNAALCLIVVLIHVISAPLASLTPEAALYIPYMALNRCATFVVQAFIFQSGMKTFLGNKSSRYGDFMYKKIKTIFIPYVIAVIIYYLLFVYILHYFDFSLRDLVMYIAQGNIAAQFYFIIIIMQFYILYPLWKCIIRQNPVIPIGVSVILTAILGLYMIFILDRLFKIDYFPYIDRFFTTYLMYWIGGMFAGKYYDKFIKFVSKNIVFIFIAFVLCAVIDNICFYRYVIHLMRATQLDVLHAAYCISAILLCTAVSYKLRNKHIKAIDTIDKASYYIYLFHVLFIFAVDYIMPRLDISISSTTGLFLVRLILVYLAVFVFANIYVFAKKRQGSKSKNAQRKNRGGNAG